MAKILILAKSGFGKSTSIGRDDSLNIKGLNPSTTFIISVKNKSLPFPGSVKSYKITDYNHLKEGNRIIVNDGDIIAKVLESLADNNCPFSDIIIDDTNYIMQDYYMANALKSGWDCPKKIGYFMGKVFSAIDLFSEKKNVYILAHSEDITGNDGRIYSKFKTTGKMIDEYCTPEGLFETVLIGRSRFDSSTKSVIKEFVTNEDEFCSSAKSPRGMFDSLYIPNDLGYIKESVEKYYFGEQKIS